MTCSGGAGVYSPFRVVITNDTTVVLDTTISDAQEGINSTIISHPWILSPGVHTVRMMLDSLNDVNETDETDNAWSGQWVWSPLVLARRTPEGRLVPPPRGLLGLPNGDGMSFTPAAACAWSAALAPLGTADEDETTTNIILNVGGECFRGNAKHVH
jgi:hypothetical protein